MTAHDMTGHDLAWQDTTAHDMTAHDMTGHDLAWQDTTAHDMTVHFPMRFQSRALHDMTTAARRGRGRGHRRKKRQSCAHSCCQRSLTPIQAHALPSACRAESCLLCCQPEPSLSRYLPDYHALLHDSLADCKLKGDELST